MPKSDFIVLEFMEKKKCKSIAFVRRERKIQSRKKRQQHDSKSSIRKAKNNPIDRMRSIKQ